MAWTNPIFTQALEKFGKPVVESIGSKIKDERQLNSMRSALQDLYKSIEQEEIARTTVPMPTGVGFGGALEMGQMQVPQTPQIQAELGELQKRKDYLMNHPLYGGLIRGEIKSVDEAKARASVQFPVAEPIEWKVVSGQRGNKKTTMAYNPNNPNQKMILMEGNELTSAGSEFQNKLVQDIIDRARKTTDSDVKSAFGKDSASIMELFIATGNMETKEANKYIENYLSQQMEGMDTAERDEYIAKVQDFRADTFEKNLRKAVHEYKEFPEQWALIPDALKREGKSTLLSGTLDG